MSFINSLINAFQKVMAYMMGIPWDIGERIAESLMNSPVVENETFQAALPYLEWANAWAPVAEAAVAITGLWAFQMGFIFLKLVFKAIPTVG